MFLFSIFDQYHRLSIIQKTLEFVKTFERKFLYLDKISWSKIVMKYSNSSFVLFNYLNNARNHFNDIIKRNQIGLKSFQVLMAQIIIEYLSDFGIWDMTVLSKD